MKICDLIRIFLEKNFIYTLVSIVVTFLIYFFTSNDYILLIKFGKWGYLGFVFIVIYLIIVLVVYGCKKIYNSIRKHRISNKKQEVVINETLKLLWKKVDELSPYEYKILMFFLDNENRPISIRGYLIGNKILNDQWCKNREVQIEDDNIKSFDIVKLEETDVLKKGEVVHKYVLRDEIYKALKYSKEKFGRISSID